MKRILVMDGRHGVYTWDASDDELLGKAAVAALAVNDLAHRFYPAPSPLDIPANDRELLDMPSEAVNALPQGLRAGVIRTRSSYSSRVRDNKDYEIWYRELQLLKASSAPWAEMCTVGRGDKAREVPTAWVLLEQRSDYQYERVWLADIPTASGEYTDRDAREAW